MNVTNLRIYSSKNKKYKLTKVVAGVLTVQLLASVLTGCGLNRNNDYSKNTSNPSYYEDYYGYVTENTDVTEPSIENDIPSETLPPNNNNRPNIVPELDEYSLGIINSKVTLDSNELTSFINYVKGINVNYTYSSLYSPGAMLSKYESLGEYNSSCENIFNNNEITGDQLYKIVKQNNKDFGVVEIATMSDSDLKEVCNIIADVLNDYIKKHPDTDLHLLSEKVNDLKILKFSDFSNGYFDSTNGKMGFDVSFLKSKPNDFFKKTVEHETYHFIQGNSLGEISNLNLESRMGIAYKFDDVKVNSLLWDWYYEGSAEYLVCNRNNTKNTEVYKSLIKSIDTIKTATILSQNNKIIDFENLSLSSNLNDLFNYFGCETLNDRLEVINLMYSYNILYNINFSVDDFYSHYKSTYGKAADKLYVEKDLNNSIAQSLTKYFYRDLAILVMNKEVSIEEIFSLISVFENEISREIWYTSNQNTLNGFFEMYNDIQSNFFEMISKKINVSLDNVQQAYNSYNKQVEIDLSNMTIIDEDKIDFYKFILETRKNDKMNSINFVSEKYNSNNKQR